MNINQGLGFDALTGNLGTILARASLKGRNLTANERPRDPIHIS
jgi:hypothetical protein